MELKKPAVAGTLESSDVQIMLRPNPGQGIQIDLKSDVKALFGDAIEATVRSVLEEFAIIDAIVDVARHAKRYYFVSQKVAVKSLGPYG